MSTPEPSAPSRPPNWFLYDGTTEHGPLSEVELRRRLSAATEDAIPAMRVRQGSSAWHSAQSILSRFKQLAENGVYLRRGQITEGPFTIPRAIEILRTSAGSSILVRNGRHQPWGTVDQFLRRVEPPRRDGHRADDEPLATAVLVNDDPGAKQHEPGGASHFVPAELIVDAEPVVDAELIVDAELVTDASPHRPPPAGAPRYVVPIPVASSPVPKSSSAGGAWPWYMLVAAGGVLLVLPFAAVVAYVVLRGPTEAPWSLASSDSRSSSASSPGGSGSGSPARNPPIITPGVLFRPTFQTTAGEVEAGTAFAARVPGSNRAILLSALHLLGPAGGLPQDIPATQVPMVLQSMSLVDCISGSNVHLVAGRPLLLPQSRPFPNESPMGDVLAYLADSHARFQPLVLATEPTKTGETVWLVSETADSTAVTHRATVEGVESGWLVYQFDAQIELRATSGAPVVNANHQVVAIHAGGGEQDGAMIGVGTPTTQFLIPLSAAARLR